MNNIYAVTAWQEGRLVGLAPLWFPSTDNVLAFIGEPLNDENTFLLDGNDRARVSATIFDIIGRKLGGCHFTARARAKLSISPSAPLHGSAIWRTNIICREPSASLILPRSWDQYLNSLTDVQKSKFVYVLKRSERDLALRFSIDIAPSIAPAEAQQLVDLREESMSWRGLWQLCPPEAKDSRFVHFIEEICSELPGKSGGIHLAKLYEGMNLVAAGLYLRFQKTVMKYCQGWATKLHKYSLGTVLDLKVIEWSILNQMQEFDLGRGDEQYKRQLGADLVELTTWEFDKIATTS